MVVDKTDKRYLGWLIWFVAALFYGYEFLHRVVPAISTNHMRIAFDANDQALGLIGAMYFYAYALFQLPAGLLIDRYGVKRLLLVASLVLTLGSFLFTTTAYSSVAMVGRFLIGTGSAFAFIACLKLASFWLPRTIFPLIVGLTNFMGTLGALSGGLPLSYAVEKWGWHDVMLYLSYLGLGLSCLMFFLLPHDRHTLSEPLPKQAMKTALFKIVACRQTWFIALYAAFLVVPIITLPEMWGVEYLKIAYQMSSTEAASFTHTIFIGTAIGGPVTGLVASLFTSKKRLMIISTTLALMCLIWVIYAPAINHYGLYLILFCYGFFTTNMLLSFSLISTLHPKWAEGTAIGFVNSMIMLVGGIAQHFAGAVLEFLRQSHDFMYLKQDYQLALIFLPLCLLAALLLTRFIQEPHV